MFEFHLNFHHIGVATKSIEKELSVFKTLGYRPVSDIFTDEIQNIRGLFIEAPGQPCLELLENLTPEGPLMSCLQKGIKFYHFAYETEDMDADVAFLSQEKKARIIVPVTVADYFERICFLMLPNMMMIELVEKKKVA